MQYEAIAIAVGGVLILLVLIRISLTLNEISSSLRKLARRRSEPGKAVAATVLHDGADEENGGPGEVEIAAAIALARASLGQDRPSIEGKE